MCPPIIQLSFGRAEVDESVNLPYDDESPEALITLANTHCCCSSSRVSHART